MTSPPLHVVRCYPRRPPCSGGMEKHIAALSLEQRKLGVRVTDVFNEGEVEGEGVRILPGLRLGRIPRAIVRDFLFYLAAALRLRRLCANSPSLVVHVHGDWSAFLFARLMRHSIGADLFVASFHGKARMPRVLAHTLRGVDLVYSTGKAFAVYVPKARHLVSAPSEIFFETAEEAPAADVLLVGSLVGVKNYDLLLDVAERLPSVRFAVLGTGPEEDRLRDANAARGIKNIDWRGSASAGDVRDAMAASKLFLNLSKKEGSPTAALEAMAVGTPVVLTPSNDYSALVEESESGVVLNGWDCDEIVATLRKLLTDSNRRAAMGRHARQRAAGERWHIKARQITDAMIEALERKAG